MGGEGAGGVAKKKIYMIQGKVMRKKSYTASSPEKKFLNTEKISL